MADIKVGVESTQISAIVVENTKPRYNPDDPYDTPEEHAETNDFIFNTFFFWTGAGGTFSTWRERHIFLRGFFNGFKTELQGKFTDVPTMWADEGQYYEFGQEAGYVVRNGFIFMMAGAVGTELAINSGTIFDTIVKIISVL